MNGCLKLFLTLPLCCAQILAKPIKNVTHQYQLLFTANGVSLGWSQENFLSLLTLVPCRFTKTRHVAGGVCQEWCPEPQPKQI
jgi:hypothetical protein